MNKAHSTFFLFSLGMLTMLGSAWVALADEPAYVWQQRRVAEKSNQALTHTYESAVWLPQETAVIVCDVWDYHHSINAVRRMEEMLPRMNAFLKEARKRGSIIVHSPSDCMPNYETHPARRSAVGVPSSQQPTDIAAWCSRIPAEEASTYPIDQSDGGEDDDPSEHQTWAEKLRSLGRNPAMPWKAQNGAIEIDGAKDYISDRGDEVWNILQARNIRHVILVGVHTNMCVLGRPFGLRQMVRQKMDVVLVRDLTDCMYNPKSWPFVDHFTGNDLVIAHVERFVCPTITSDQLLGGDPIRFQGDRRTERDCITAPQSNSDRKNPNWWMTDVPTKPFLGELSANKNAWIRCAVRFPRGKLEQPATLTVDGQVVGAWLNGKPLHAVRDPDFSKPQAAIFQITPELTFGNDDPNLLVLCFDITHDDLRRGTAPRIDTATGVTELAGQWQVRRSTGQNAILPNDPQTTNIPLPAKFGLPPQIFYNCK